MASAPGLIVNLPGAPFNNLPEYGSPAALRAVLSSGINPNDEAIITPAGVGSQSGIFIYSASSLVADDGINVLKPNDLTPLQAGRWLSTLFLKISGPPGSPGGNIMSVGLFTAMAGVSIPLGTTTVRTAGHHVSGVGAATYVMGTTANPNLPGAGQFKDAAGIYWTYALDGQASIEQFGGIADCPVGAFDYSTFTTSRVIPTSVTDNSQPLLDAFNVLTAGKVAYGAQTPVSAAATVFCAGAMGLGPAQGYYFSKPIIPPYSCAIKGTAPGVDWGVGTTFIFPPNTSGLILNSAGQQPAGYAAIGATGFCCEGIYFRGGGGTDRTAHGFIPHVFYTLRNCVFESFAGDNQHDDSRAGGQTSGSQEYNVTCRNAGNWNTFRVGPDSSASIFINLHHNNSRLGGLYDAGYFNNTYIGYQNNAHGTGHLGGCSYGGNQYALISNTPGVGGSTRPGTNEMVWQYQQGGPVVAAYPAWTSGGDYELSLPFFVNPNVVLLSAYVEDYYLPGLGGYVLGSPKTTNQTNAPGVDPGDGVFYQKLASGYRRYPGPGTSEAAIVGTYIDGSLGAQTPGAIRRFSRQKDGGNAWLEQFNSAGDIQFGYGGEGSGNPFTLYYTTQRTALTFGRSAAQPFVMLPGNLAIPGLSSGGDSRIVTASSVTPATDTAKATGEPTFNTNPSKGAAAGWTRMSDGTVQPTGIVGAIRAAGLSSSSTAAQIVAALQAAGLAS